MSARAICDWRFGCKHQRQSLAPSSWIRREGARLTPDGKLVCTFTPKEVRTPADLLDAAKALLNQLVTYV
jgi:hypothetical protein